MYVVTISHSGRNYAKQFGTELEARIAFYEMHHQGWTCRLTNPSGEVTLRN